MSEAKLENSMAVDISQITIPMSLNDFARRERFNVAFQLLVATHERMEAIIKRLVATTDYPTCKHCGTELNAHTQTLGSILKSIKDGEKDDG